MAGYRWLLARGTPPDQIVLAGDSAGGGLTIATLVELRNQQVPLPAAAVCISPWVDMEASGASIEGNAGTDPMIDKTLLLQMAGGLPSGDKSHGTQWHHRCMPI